MRVISVREHPEYAERAIAWFQACWATKASRPVYDNCIRFSLCTAAPLPQWYLLIDGDSIAGGAGLITNDFVSRMDLTPWLCALFVEPEYRGRHFSSLLVNRARRDAARMGFAHLYLCTDLAGFYEKLGGCRIGVGYHPWGECSDLYRFDTRESETERKQPLPTGAVHYSVLSPANFHRNSLDRFIRHQQVRECWRRVGGELALVPVEFTEEWDIDALRGIADTLLREMAAGAYACGAFCGEDLIGYLLLLSARFGSRKQYAELKEFYVSEPYRGCGIGRALFRMGCEYARRQGVPKLYLSAHSSRESQEVYRRLGCVEAEEPDPVLAAREPCDVQMEYVLEGGACE